MNKKIIIPVLIATLFASSMPAFAQGRGNGNGNGRDNHGHEDRDDGSRRNDRGNYQQEERHDNGNHGDRGAGPRHDMRKGNRLPPEYRHKQYVVNDWRGHHLNAPPRGYQWVQTGGDYVLAAVATGLILQVLLNN
jgi:Ni/Co efflux regulator RcnB